MVYLLGSILFLSLNNFLWANYAPKLNPLVLINRRAFFTVIFTATILAVVLALTEVQISNTPILELIGVSIIGFVGLCFLVLGFKKGSLLIFLNYSLLFTVCIAFLTEYIDSFLSAKDIIILVFIFSGYLYYIYQQYKEQGSFFQKYTSHFYFIIAHFCFGVLLYFQWKYVQETPQIVLAFIQELVVFVCASFLIYLLPSQKNKQRELLWWQYALLALPISFAVILGLEGLKVTNPFHSVLVNLLTPVFTLILGVAFKIEKLKWRAIAGLLVMISGLAIFYLV